MTVCMNVLVCASPMCGQAQACGPAPVTDEVPLMGGLAIGIAWKFENQGLAEAFPILLNMTLSARAGSL